MTATPATHKPRNRLFPNVFSARVLTNPTRLLNEEAESHGIE